MAGNVQENLRDCRENSITFKGCETRQSIMYVVTQKVLEMDGISEDARGYFLRKQVVGVLVSHGQTCLTLPS